MLSANGKNASGTHHDFAEDFLFEGLRVSFLRGAAYGLRCRARLG